MASGSPLPTLDALFLTPPHSAGEGQWDETGEIEGMDSPRPLWRCPGSPPCLPWNHLSVCRTISGRSPPWAALMKGVSSLVERRPWDILLGWCTMVEGQGIWGRVTDGQNPKCKLLSWLPMELAVKVSEGHLSFPIFSYLICKMGEIT